MLKIIVALLLAAWLSGPLPAQDIQVNEPPRVTDLMKAWQNANRSQARVSGWRVQILSTNDRSIADAARNRFRGEYPDLPAEWVHERPYYKLRVGAFRTRAEAMQLIADLSATYPGCYPAQDPAIHPRDFLRQ
jgi:hypothetical protein